MGYEFVGTIVALGLDVSGWSVGEWVIEVMNEFCGGCDFCVVGFFDFCYYYYILESEFGVDVYGCGRVVVGGYVFYFVMEVNCLMCVLDDFSDEVVANVEVVVVGFYVVSCLGICLGEDVVIFGVGSIGLYLL